MRFRTKGFRRRSTTRGVMTLIYETSSRQLIRKIKAIWVVTPIIYGVTAKCDQRIFRRRTTTRGVITLISRWEEQCQSLADGRGSVSHWSVGGAYGHVTKCWPLIGSRRKSNIYLSIISRWAGQCPSLVSGRGLWSRDKMLASDWLA